MNKVKEIVKRSPFNQHSEKFLVDLEDMNWLTEQAERVEELVKDNIALENLQRKTADNLTKCRSRLAAVKEIVNA